MSRAGPCSAIVELDEVLEAMVRRELEAVNVDGVSITFEAPDRERVAGWPSPALNLFLYDVRESEYVRDRSWQRDPSGLGAAIQRSPLRLECSYAITAWTRTTTDEHRLLSEVLGILLAYPQIPVDLLSSGLLVGAPPVPLSTRVAHGKAAGRPDFWTAIGSPYKLSLELAVTILVPAAQRRAAGPPVQRAVVAFPGPPPATVAVQAGRVRRRDGTPAAGALVLATDAGIAAVADADGRFRLIGLPDGAHRGEVRDVDGSASAVELTSDPSGIDLVL
jgi:Pvc16 N-terminal domain